MAKNTGSGMKRTAIRHIRDGIKTKYQRKDACECCGTTEDLELHHPHTVSLLFNEFCKKRDIAINTDEDALAIREDFYAEYWDELVVDVLTLCNTHHKSLHKVYGKQPPLATAEKQKQWVSRIREKQEQGTDSHLPTGNFSRFATKPFTSFRS